MDEQQKPRENVDEQPEDLEVREEQAEDVKGGITVRKAGGEQQEYLSKYADIETSY